MSREPASEPAADPPAIEDAAASRFFASPAAMRKGRFLALLLLVNWAVMGIYVLSQGVRSLVGGLAFALGLFALIGGLTYLRAVRAAAVLALIELDDSRIRYRRFSSTELSVLELDQVEGIVERSRDAIVLGSRSDERTEIPWVALAETDRDRLAGELARRARR
jgi:hypothetical protein